MKKEIKTVLLIVLLCIVLIPVGSIAYLLFIQEDLFFPKKSDEESYNALLKMEEFEEVKLDNNGNTVTGWIRYSSKKEKSPLIIYFGGNFQNASGVFNKFFKDKYDYFENYSMMMVDYPKYGHSEGEITENDLFNEALLVYDYSSELELIDKDNIVIIGYSIGTGMATYLASQREVKGLILVAPYDELLSIYNANVPIFFGPLKKLAKYKLESKKYAESVKVTPLIITSYEDKDINHIFSERLAEHFEKIDKLIIEKDLQHSEYFYNKSVLEEIQDYLRKCKEQ